MLKVIPFIALGATLLSGCVDRAAADAKLARGCAAGAELFLEEGFEIKDITKKSFQDDPGLGKGYRTVTLDVIESDGWYDGEATYRCIFVESVNIIGRHSATIYQLRIPDGYGDDKVFGQEGDKILGSFNDHLKLTETVEQGMQ